MTQLGPLALAKLTDKQELFCLNIYAGMSNVEAWINSYDHGGTRKTASESASKLMANPRIQHRLKELRDESNRRARVTLEDHLKRLEELGRGAQDNGQFSAAINAELNRGKASGIYVERKEITGADGGPINHSIRVVFGNEPLEDDDDSEIPANS
jgi:phage terminase small subunit